MVYSRLPDVSNDIDMDKYSSRTNEGVYGYIYKRSDT